MDQEIEQFINHFVQATLTSPHFTNLPEEQKKQIGQQITTYFNGIVTDTLIDNLTDEQVAELENMDLNTEQAENKVALYAAQIPGFLFIIQDKLQSETDKIRNSGQIPQ